MSVVQTYTKAERLEREELQYRCRAGKNHWMDPCGQPADFTPTGLFRAARIINHFVCVKCGTTRHDAISATGGLMLRRYYYPEGYLLSGDEARPTADELRLWIARRNKTMGISG